MKKILVIGSDGYIGFALCKVLLKAGHMVAGLDNGIRRAMVEEMGSNSIIPVLPIDERHLKLAEDFSNYQFLKGSTLDYELLCNLLGQFQPDAIIHLGEQPSAPYSQRDVFHSCATQNNNVLGTLNLLWAMKTNCPDAHLVKLGSMGEYGTQNNLIPEEDFTYHKQPGSFYHASKVHDSFNINLACRIWNLSCTDIMQGVVYGLNDCKCGKHLTRFDYDETFGTVINRFIASAIIGEPLTVYGKGGQTRGFLPLMDSLQCIQVVIDNPAEKGEHRIINQFAKTYSVKELAGIVKKVGNEMDLDVDFSFVENPRKEKEEHTYEVVHKWLEEHGYKPNHDIEGVIKDTITRLIPFKERIKKEVIEPKTTWV